MNNVTANDGSDDRYVIGNGLPVPLRQRLSAAFPHCILRAFGPHTWEQTKDLCLLLGRVVVFTYIPSMSSRKWLRVSAIFDTMNVKVVGIHPECDDTIYDRALEAEFAGVIEADATPATYRRAAMSVQRGELWFPRGYLSQRTRESLSTTSPDGLSQREADILDLLASGITNQRIAERLFISRDTVRWHLRSIYTKLGVSDREAAYRLAKNRLASTMEETLARQ